MTQGKRTVVILNPRAGSGHAMRRWPELGSRLSATLGPYETWETGRPGDAGRLAARALDEGVDRIIAVGGDGTFSEVIDGWLDPSGRPRRPEAVLGLLPFGTGGDFKKTVGLHTVDDALGALAVGDERVIDVGRVRYRDHEGREATRCFLNIGGFGVGGLVDAYANETPHPIKRLLGGKLTFMIATVRAYVRYRNRRVRLRFDDGPFEEQVINHVAIANGQYFGGGMWIAPHAELADGRFDVVVLGDLNVGELIRDSGAIYKGTHLSLPKVRSARARRVEAEPVDAGEPVLLEIDGEQPGRLPATFDLLPGVLRLAVPRGLAGDAGRPALAGSTTS